MKDKITKTTAAVQQTTNDIKTVAKNAARLIEASALVIVAGYAIAHTLPSTHEVTAQSAVLLTAGLIIALRGAWEFLRYLANKEQ